MKHQDEPEHITVEVLASVGGAQLAPLFGSPKLGHAAAARAQDHEAASGLVHLEGRGLLTKRFFGRAAIAVPVNVPEGETGRRGLSVVYEVTVDCAPQLVAAMASSAVALARAVLSVALGPQPEESETSLEHALTVELQSSGRSSILEETHEALAVVNRLLAAIPPSGRTMQLGAHDDVAATLGSVLATMHRGDVQITKGAACQFLRADSVSAVLRMDTSGSVVVPLDGGAFVMMRQTMI